MAIVGSAHVEIHAITTAVRDELREGLRRATAGVGADAGREFGAEFGNEANERIGDAARRSRRETVRQYGNMGDESGKSFFSRLASILSRKVSGPKIEMNFAPIRQAIVNIAALVNALQVVALPAAALAILPFLVSLAADAKTAMGIVNLLPAAMLGLAASVATLVIGFNGLGEALGPTGTPAQLEKVRAAMAKLPPAARDVVRSIRSLSDEWGILHRAVQQNLFADVGKDIRALGGIYLPLLTDQLGRTATAYNIAARATIGVLLAPQSIADTNTGLGNMNAGLTSAAGAAAPLTAAFRDIAVVGSEFFPRWGAGFAGMAERFRAFIAEARATGELRTWIQNALDVFSQLGRIAENVGSIISSTFGAIRQTGESTLDILERISGQAAAALKTPEGAESLRNFFQTIRDLVSAFIDKLVALWPLISQAARTFLALYQAAEPLLAVITRLLVAALVPLLKLLEDMAPVLGPLLVLFASSVAIFRALSAATLIVRSAMFGYSVVMGTLTVAQALNTDVTKLNTAAVVVAKGVALAVRSATVAWTAAQWALNVALTANPIGVVIAVIGLLIAAVVAIGYGIYQLIKNWDSVWSGIKDVTSAVVDWFKGPFLDFFKGIPAFFEGVWSSVAGFFTDAWSTIEETVSSAFDSVVTFFQELPGRVGGFFVSLGQTIRTGATNAWHGLLDGLSTAWDAVIDFIADLPNSIAYGLGYLVGAVARWGYDTWNSLYDALVTAWGNTVDFLTALPGNVANFFVGLYDTVTDWAVRTWSSVVDAVVDAWNNTISWLGGLPGRIGAWFTDLRASVIVWAGKTWTSVTDAAATAWADTIVFLGNLPGRIGEFFTNLRTSMIVWAGETWNSFTDAAVAAWSNTVTFLEELPGQINDMFIDAANWLVEAGGNIIDGLWQGIQNAWNSFTGWLDSLWDSFIQGFKDAFGISSPSTVFAEFGRWILEGLINGLNALISNVTQFFLDLWNSIRDTAETSWNNIHNFFVNAFDAFTQVFHGVWNAIRDFFASIWNGIRDFGVAIWNALVAFYDSGFTDFRGLFQAAWTAIRDFFSAIWNAIRDAAVAIWTTISTFFSNAFTGFTNYFITAWNNIKNAFSNIWDGIKNVGINIWNSIHTFFVTAFNNFTSMFTNVWNAVRDSFDRAFGGIKDIATRIWDDIKNIFSGAINLVIKVPNWIIDNINTLFGTGIARVPDFHFARGGSPADVVGPVKGRGGERQDRVHAMLSPREHVWSAQEVRGAGGHEGVRRLREAARSRLLQKFAGGGFLQPYSTLPAGVAPGAFVVPPNIAQRAPGFLKALSQGQPEAVQATGGRFARLAAGGNIEHALSVGRGMAGTPYVWGGASRSGADCSGFQSIITRALRGEANPYARIGTTATFPWSGFKTGMGTYTIGNTRNAFNSGVGHMASTLQGTNLESGSGHGAMVGGKALGATNSLFGMRAFLPEIGGVFTPGGDGGGGGIDYGALFDSLAGWVKSAAHGAVNTLVPANPPPEFFRGMANSTIDQAWGGIRTTAIKVMESIGNVVGAIVGGTNNDTAGVKGIVQNIFGAAGWGSGAQWDAVDWIVNKESGWNAKAQNPTSSASGLFQFIDSTWASYGNKLYAHMKDAPADQQGLAGRKYIGTRYGSPVAAKNFHVGHGWYDSGGWLTPGVTVAHNETGRSEIIGPVEAFRLAMIDALRHSVPTISAAITRGSSAQIEQFAHQIVVKQQQITDDREPALVGALTSSFANAAELIKAGTAVTTAPAPTESVKPSMSFHEGAFSVVIQGNADAVTVDELRTVLQGWGEQVMREYETRK